MDSSHNNLNSVIIYSPFQEHKRRYILKKKKTLFVQWKSMGPQWFSKYLILCSAEERTVYRFGKKWQSFVGQISVYLTKKKVSDKIRIKTSPKNRHRQPQCMCKAIKETKQVFLVKI